MAKLAGSGTRYVVADANGDLSATGSTALVDTLTISTRAWRQKGLDSLAALEVSGSGTTNYIPKFTAASTIGNSIIQDNGTGVGIGGTQLDRLTIFQDQNATTTARVRNTDVGSSAYSQFVVNASGNSWGFRMGSSAANSNALDIVSDALGTPASRLRIFANGRIGVNTTTDAGYQLDVNGSIRASGVIRSAAAVGVTTGFFQLDHPGAQTWKIGVFSDNTSTFSIGNDLAGTFASRYLNITNAGNVGIGTTSPQQKLVVSNAGAEGLEFIPAPSANSNQIQSYNRSTSAWNSLILRASEYNVQIGTTATLYISGSGNVGIGTTSPSEKLHISGNVIATDVAGAYPRFVSQVGAKYWEMGYRSGTTNFEIREDGTTRFIIDNGGEVFINTDSDAGNYKLQVSGQAFIRNTATSGALYLDSTSLSIYEVKDRHAILITGHSLTGAEIQGPIYVGTNWNTSSDVSAIEVALTNTASGANSNLIKLSDGTNTFRVTKDAGLFTSAPSGGTARKWKFGSAATVSPTSPNRTIQIEVDGVVYYLHAKTTND
jgi:hypothetical protein